MADHAISNAQAQTPIMVLHLFEALRWFEVLRWLPWVFFSAPD
jgi:hypothetical protein